jgi:hypothetical protein
MASTINASNSGFGGIVSTGDSSGELALQAAGTTAVTINTSGAIGVGSTPSYGTSGQLLTSAGSSAAPTWTTVSSSPTTLKYVTDTTNITLVNIASSQVNVGSSFSVSIPTTGYINVTSFAGRLTWSSVADNVGCVLGIRIGSTNYWFGKFSNNGTIYYTGLLGSRTSAGYDEWYGSLIKNTAISSNATDAAPLGIDIIANSVPTGTQTVQLIAAYGAIGYTGIGILSGATTTTRVALEFVSAS